MQHFSLVPLARKVVFRRLQILVAEAFRYVGDIRPGTLQHRSERMTRRIGRYVPNFELLPDHPHPFID